MTAPIIAIRPEPGLGATQDLGRALGLDILGVPLSRIVPLGWTLPDPEQIDGVLAGSANAFLHGGPNLARLRDKPVFAVGGATAEAARAAGFAVAAIGSGGLQAVLDAVPAPCRLLRIAGEEHVAVTPPPGVSVAIVTVYRSETIALEAPAWPGAGLVLLHSAAAARHFGAECDRIGLARRDITLAALGERIAGAAGVGWRAVHIAPLPSDRALLEMVRELCKDT